MIRLSVGAEFGGIVNVYVLVVGFAIFGFSGFTWATWLVQAFPDSPA